MKRTSVAIAIVAAGAGAAGPGLAAEAAPVRCGGTITADTMLRQDLACEGSPALRVQGPAALDLGGRVVRCTDAVPPAGACIDLVGTGARLRSGGVGAHRSAAVRLGGGGGHTVQRITAISGEDVGFEVRSNGNHLRDNTDIYSGAYGFYVSGDGSRLQGNTSSGSVDAGFAVTGADNHLQGNTAVRIELAGFVVTGRGNRLIANRAIGFGPNAGIRSPFGIVLPSSADATTVIANRVTGTGHGMEVRSDGNELRANEVHGNQVGISLWDGAAGNAITGNRATGNAGVDLVDGNAGCDGNTWRGNTFNSATQHCIF